MNFIHSMFSVTSVFKNTMPGLETNCNILIRVMMNGLLDGNVEKSKQASAGQAQPG